MARDNLCALSSVWILDERAVIWARLCLFRKAAMEMKSPLTTHLCAAHMMGGLGSSIELSWK